MDINELLKGVECSCGRTHTCPIQYVYIEKNAMARLTDICAEYNKILIVSDENTFAAAGEQTVAALSGKDLRRVTFTGKEILVPSEPAIEEVTRNLGDAELIIGIGSGVIQDLCKYVSHFEKVPYMVVATAPSMDGYASTGAAMITGGMKVTYSAGLPVALVADTAVLAQAPLEMLKAGYGDVIGKFSALNDWELSREVTGEYFCQYIYDLTYRQIETTLQLADGILQRNEDSIKALMDALVIIGIMMSFAGSSRPASGSEHHLSHFFEVTGIVDGTEYFPHGIDVAYSTVITAGVREKILAKPFPKAIYRPETSFYEAEMTRIYKEVAPGFMELQKKIGAYETDRSEIYLSKEEKIREIFAKMPTADEILAMLAKVEMNIDEFYALYGEKKIRDAVLYAKDIKDRYSALWVNYDYYGGEQ